MRELLISIEYHGRQQVAGYIRGNDSYDACFSYAEEYLNLPDILPISVSLPLQREPFSAELTTQFFEGLLPEGFSRKAVANWAKTDENDYLAILLKLGQECLGAIQVADPDGPEPESFYELLTPDQVQQLAAEGATKSTEILMETHLSLTGASGKVGLLYDAEHDNWYLPKGDAASSHIVKQSHVRLDQIVLNEQLSILAAGNLGIQVPESFIINLGDGEDENVLYATKRYDRVIRPAVDGRMQSPYRLHQEDFAQALGIPGGKKYEIENRGYIRKMFDLVQDYSTNPLEDRLRLWDMIVFDFLIGNTDGHIKNFSLLYDEDLTGMRLAPAYDMICTRAYQSTRDMSFFIGGELDITKMNRETFRRAAKEVGLGEKLAMKRFDALYAGFPDALRKAAETMTSLGFHRSMEMSERMLQASGYAQIAQ